MAMPHSKKGASTALMTGLSRLYGCQGWSSAMRSVEYPTSLSLPSTFVHVWCRSLCVCFHAAAGVTKSHSHVVLWMSGSRIQSHWPWSTLCRSSMFSSIFATESIAVPATKAVFLRETRRVARPAISSVRWTLMTRRMYAASLAPRDAMMRSRMASSSWPSRSTCSSLRWAAARGRDTGCPVAARTGFLGRTAVAPSAPSAGSAAGAVGLFTVVVMVGCPLSDVQVDGSGGGVDARLDELALVAVHVAGAQVAHLSGDERDEAAAADAHAAPARHDDPALLAGVEEGDVAIDLHLLVRLLEGHEAALPARAGKQGGSEALDREVVVGVVVAVAQPQLCRRVEEVGRPTGVCRPVAPVGAERLE